MMVQHWFCGSMMWLIITMRVPKHVLAFSCMKHLYVRVVHVNHRVIKATLYKAALAVYDARHHKAREDVKNETPMLV